MSLNSEQEPRNRPDIMPAESGASRPGSRIDLGAGGPGMDVRRTPRGKRRRNLYIGFGAAAVIVVTVLLARLGPVLLHQPEIQHFDEVDLHTVAAEEDVRWLDVTVDQAAAMCLVKGMTSLSQDVDRALLRLHVVLTQERIEIHAVEKLHHIVKRPVAGETKIEELNRVRRTQLGGGLCFAFEALEDVRRFGRCRAAEVFGLDELDRSGPREQSMRGLPDLAHAPSTEELHQVIAAKRACLRQLFAEAVDDARHQHSQGHGHHVGPAQSDERGWVQCGERPRRDQHQRDERFARCGS